MLLLTPRPANEQHDLVNTVEESIPITRRLTDILVFQRPIGRDDELLNGEIPIHVPSVDLTGIIIENLDQISKSNAATRKRTVNRSTTQIIQKNHGLTLIVVKRCGPILHEIDIVKPLASLRIMQSSPRLTSAGLTPTVFHKRKLILTCLGFLLKVLSFKRLAVLKVIRHYHSQRRVFNHIAERPTFLVDLKVDDLPVPKLLRGIARPIEPLVLLIGHGGVHQIVPSQRITIIVLLRGVLMDKGASDPSVFLGAIGVRTLKILHNLKMDARKLIHQSLAPYTTVRGYNALQMQMFGILTTFKLTGIPVMGQLLLKSTFDLGRVFGAEAFLDIVQRKEPVITRAGDQIRVFHC
ncbi:hypothetical protein BBCT_0718 [Bifidobacterium catenulatum DSM 16992 = JCM 1194 = LMG 11043]|uniref:Uncharacterized protein n=1 Tax=Bifidobacterium catenulatum DSM 16992 = JCM 1194 = LMG 11043 TaxID=566552 RepID=A0ABN5V1J0_9BIFI|nr:hypothetical protein BBCT_0718 [Bifidobacterium catenulatum DSM 16992 = JCM 1194 = LMG 11043]